MTTGPRLCRLASLRPVIGAVALGHRSHSVLKDLIAAVVHAGLAVFPLLTLVWPGLLATWCLSATVVLLASAIRIWRCIRSVRHARRQLRNAPQTIETKPALTTH